MEDISHKYLPYQTKTVRFHTIENIRLSSDSVHPNKTTRSQSLFGYDSLRNMIISASMPVAAVPCLHTYLSGRFSALARRGISSLENLKKKII